MEVPVIEAVQPDCVAFPNDVWAPFAKVKTVLQGVGQPSNQA